MNRTVLGILLLGVCCVIATVALFQWPRHVKKATQMYEGVAMISIHDDSSLWLPGNDVLTEIASRQIVMSAYHIKGPQALGQLLIDLDLTVGIPRKDDGSFTPEGEEKVAELLDELSQNITVKTLVSDRNSTMLALEVRHADAAMASKIANRLADNFLRKLSDEFNGTLRDTRRFFDSETHRWVRATSEADGKMLRFAIINMDYDLSNPIALFKQLEATKARHAELREQQQVTIVKLDAIKQWHQEQPDFIEKKTSETTKEESPNQDKLDAEVDITKLATQLGKLKNECTAAEDQMRSLELVNRNYFVLKREKDRLEKEAANAKRQLEHWEGMLFRLDTANATFLAERGVRWSVIRRSPDLARPYVPDLPGSNLSNPVK